MNTKKTKTIPANVKKAGFKTIAKKLLGEYGKFSKSVQYVVRDGVRYTLAQAKAIAHEEKLNSKATSKNVINASKKALSKLESKGDKSSNLLLSSNSYRLENRRQEFIYLSLKNDEYFSKLTDQGKLYIIEIIESKNFSFNIWAERNGKAENKKAYKEVVRILIKIRYNKENGVIKGNFCTREEADYTGKYFDDNGISRSQFPAIYGSDVV